MNFCKCSVLSLNTLFHKSQNKEFYDLTLQSTVKVKNFKKCHLTFVPHPRHTIYEQSVWIDLPLYLNQLVFYNDCKFSRSTTTLPDPLVTCTQKPVCPARGRNRRTPKWSLTVWVTQGLEWSVSRFGCLD